MNIARLQSPSLTEVFGLLRSACRQAAREGRVIRAAELGELADLFFDCEQEAIRLEAIEMEVRARDLAARAAELIARETALPSPVGLRLAAVDGRPL